MDNVVWVYNSQGKRLANTSPRNAKQWLKIGKAKFIRKLPFTIQFVAKHEADLK